MMLISYNWLQRYFEKPLPPAPKLAEILMSRAFEVEGAVEKGGDVVLNLNVLPDRAHYALCHRGVASEIHAATKSPLNAIPLPRPRVKSGAVVSVRIEAPELCSRYIARYIENVSAVGTPAWMEGLLSPIGQRTKGAIVDAANFVMFDIGQPLHVFDADLVVGGIVVRLAKDGERLHTLDGKEVTLDGETLIIADEAGPLAIAGIKGGTRAEVTGKTRRLIVESAHFNPVSIRRTATRLRIHTDASKRFENELTPHLSGEAMEQLTALILSSSPGAQAGKTTDVHGVLPDRRTVCVPATLNTELLGTGIPEQMINQLLKRLGCTVEKKSNTYRVTVPFDRLDLAIPEDVVEEVGRLWGYERIPALRPATGRKPPMNKQFYWEQKIRDLLVEGGFSEIITSSFVDGGMVAEHGPEILNPTAKDKNALRASLSSDFTTRYLELNARNTALLGRDAIRIFEIGTVFPAGHPEHAALAVGCTAEKPEEAEKILVEIRERLSAAIGIPMKADISKNVFEINLDRIIEALPTPMRWDIAPTPQTSIVYTPFSSHPFTVRDIAFFAPKERGGEEETTSILTALSKKHSGTLLVSGPRLFDRFTKDGKTSYAFRMVFQSSERTLTDVEVNDIMQKISNGLADRGYLIR